MNNTTTTSLLRIDASARHNDSVSRRLADGVEQAWLRAHAGGVVLRRDLAREPLPHISDATIKGYYTPAEQMSATLREATALSDTLIAELKSAHTVLISAPIYNFSLPSALKAWIDHIVRIGHTFAYDGTHFTGLVTRPRAVLALAYGASGYSGPLKEMDHLRPYLTQLLHFLGVAQVDVVAAEATSADMSTVSAAIAAAESAIPRLFAQEGA